MRREEKAENSRVKGGKLGACTRVSLCAHFVHKLTVVGVFISDVVECRQFRNQVSSKFNLKASTCCIWAGEIPAL